MKFTPSAKALRNNKPDPEAQARLDRIMRWVAIVVAFVSVYFFIIKILFL